MIQISLCMIVKNEEDVLARCLSSIQNCVDEIILVDTGSTDRTKEIARAFTDRIYDFPWNDDFAAARNYSFSKASCPYIFWLDADDILLKEDQQKLLQLKETLSPSIDLVMMPYHTAFDAQGNPVFTYYRERLLKRSVGYRWDGAVHEAITPSGTIQYASAAVTHRKLHASDPDRNLRIFEKLLHSNVPLDARQQFYYARELYYHERWREAADQFQLFLSNPAGWLENKITACLDLSRCLARLGCTEECMTALFQSFLYGIPRAEICCEIGLRCMEKQNDKMAVFWYETALTCPVPDQNSGFIQPDCSDLIPYLQLCVCCERLGDRTSALHWHQKAKRLRPQHPSVQYNETYFSQ